MTVTYSLNVANANLSGFSKLLIRWRGSIYKLLYREMLIFCVLYYILSFMYRYCLNSYQRGLFEKISQYCEAFTQVVPLPFVLGFYVSLVVGRWWQQYMQIPWPDKAAFLISAHVHGADERGRIIRRTLVRYLLLLQVLTCQAVSTSVRRRFPTLDHIEEAGLMTKEERVAYDEIPSTHGKWWVPAQWFSALIIRAKKDGRIKDDILLFQILEELHEYRSNCGMMFSYDWISIPLVYTQVATIATYTYFIAKLMGRQYLDPAKKYNNHEVDLYIPVFTIVEFFFFMGWLKVAEQLINPYGEDDDDFELNWCLDRNLLVTFWIVDEMYNKHPKLVKDAYWDEAEPMLPYTKSSFNLRSQPHLGSAMNLDIDLEEADFVPMETILEEDKEHAYNSPPCSPNNELILGDKEKEETSSQNRFFGDFRGSKFLNMLIGQSCENVSKTSINRSNDQNSVLIAPFILKTPQKRVRTTSMNEAINNYHSFRLQKVTPTNSQDINHFDGRRFGDLPTAPVIMNHHRPSPIASKKELDSERKSLKDEENVDIGQVRIRAPSADENYAANTGFRFPPAYIPPKNPFQYFPQHISHIQGVEENKNKSIEISMSPTISSSSRSNSRAEDASSSTHDNASTSQPQAMDVLKEEEKEKESPYEPNSSQESSPYQSNQSTITSITELLKHNETKE